MKSEWQANIFIALENNADIIMKLVITLNQHNHINYPTRGYNNYSYITTTIT